MSDVRCYTIPETRGKLQMTETTFFRLRRQGRLPFLEELKPRLGRIIRYRADLIDRYLEGRWSEPRSFSLARRRA